MTVKPSLPCRSYQPRTCGITFLQLIHPKVQNSTRTTRPRSPDMVKGSLLIQRSPATSGAAWPIPTAWASAAPTPRPADIRNPHRRTPTLLATLRIVRSPLPKSPPISSRAVFSMRLPGIGVGMSRSRSSLLHRRWLRAQGPDTIRGEPPGAVGRRQAAGPERRERPSPGRRRWAGDVGQVQDPAEHDGRDGAGAEAEERPERQRGAEVGRAHGLGERRGEHGRIAEGGEAIERPDDEDEGERSADQPSEPEAARGARGREREQNPATSEVVGEPAHRGRRDESHDVEGR